MAGPVRSVTRVTPVETQSVPAGPAPTFSDRSSVLNVPSPGTTFRRTNPTRRGGRMAEVTAESRIEAPAAKLWAQLTDWGAYGQWSMTHTDFPKGGPET